MDKQDLNHTYEKIDINRLNYLKDQCDTSCDFIKSRLEEMSNFYNYLYSEIKNKIETNRSFDKNSSEAYSQKIGYMEGKLMESIGTLDKSMLEMISHIKYLEEE